MSSSTLSRKKWVSTNRYRPAMPIHGSTTRTNAIACPPSSSSVAIRFTPATGDQSIQATIRNRAFITPVQRLSRSRGRSTSITINRQFHDATRRSGTKQIQNGAKPVILSGRVSRISRLLTLAHHCFRLVQSRTVINQSELAHFGQISTTRMTQIMWLDNLAPDIQEEILFLPRTTQGRDLIKEADIRPIAKTLDWDKQRKMWRALKMVNSPCEVVD
jgi:hypothetical protein